MRYLGACVRGKAPPLGVSPGRFWWELGRALRPHFFFIPAGAALAGAAADGSVDSPLRAGVVTFGAGLGWGVGQLLNDLLDVEADRVDAPHRATVRGLLPTGPTSSVALGLGLLVAGLMAVAAPSALVLLPAAVLLIWIYSNAKRFPAFGNLAHGALVAVAAGFGVLADPGAGGESHGAAPMLAYTGSVAALYLQANYEKDRLGDRAAGYRTLAHVLGVRGSALLRVVASVGLFAIALGQVLPSTGARAVAALGVVAVLLGTIAPLRHDTESASLSGYPWSIHGAACLMFAPTVAVAPIAALIGLGLAVLLTERARRLHENP